MKKLLITMAVLTGMVAGAMVFSSFAAPKMNEKTVCSQTSVKNGWRSVGTYCGMTDDKWTQEEKCFHIWEKDGMCNAYYWTLKSDYCKGNPDETKCESGAVRKNNEGRWYCAYSGRNYYIDF